MANPIESQSDNSGGESIPVESLDPCESYYAWLWKIAKAYKIVIFFSPSAIIAAFLIPAIKEGIKSFVENIRTGAPNALRWFDESAMLAHLLLLGVFVLAGVLLREEKGRQGLSKRHEKAQEDANAFSFWWTCYCLLWLLMYVFRFIGYFPYFIEHFEPFVAWCNLIGDCISGVLNIAFFGFYFGMVVQERRQSLKKVFGWAILACFILGFQIVNLMIKNQLSNFVCQFVMGVYAAAAICLFVGRFGSDFIAAPDLVLVSLYSYGALQVVTGTLRAALESARTSPELKDYLSSMVLIHGCVYFVIFFLKAVLLSFVYWLIKSGSLRLYFYEMAAFASRGKTRR